MTPSPFSAGNTGGSRGGIIDLPTPKRAANVYVGQRAAALPGGDMDLSALEMTIDGELPALLGDLGLDEAMDPALLALESAGAEPAPSVNGLDLSDLPAPVGPRPRSPLSTRGGLSAVAAALLASAASAPRLLQPVSGRGPVSKPGLEPEPLPAPPTREPLNATDDVLPMAAAPGTEAKISARHESTPGRPPLAASRHDSSPGRPALIVSRHESSPSRPLATGARSESAPGRPALTGPRHESVPGRPPLADSLAAPPPAERATAPSLPIPPALRDTQPIPRRASPSGALGITKPVHALFDSSEPPLPNPAPRVTETTPQMLPLPALPSDESGNLRPGSASGSASGSVSDSSGMSLITGAPGTSSTATTEPKPLRLGYLLIGLAVLALLLTVIIARIAGIWHRQNAPITEPATSIPPGEPGHRPPS